MLSSFRAKFEHPHGFICLVRMHVVAEHEAAQFFEHVLSSASCPPAQSLSSAA